MNLDQMAREATSAAREAAKAMPVVPVEGLQSRRRIRMAAPLLGLGAVASLVLVLLFAASGAPTPLQPVGPTETTTVPTPSTTVPPATTTPAATPPLDTSWARGSAERILDDQGRTLYEYPTTILYGRNTAWDGIDGFVALTESGLIWMRPDGEVTVDAPFGSIVDVDYSEAGTQIVGIDPFEGDEVVWLDLVTGDQTDPPRDPLTLDGVTFTEGGRTVTIEAPDWSDAETDEIGRPLPPFDLPTLVVTEGGEEVLRMEVGGDQLPYVNIHDFDGRRLILGAEPFEPAIPPVTAWIIDLECASCTQRIDTDSLEFFDLIGWFASNGPVVRPDLP